METLLPDWPVHRLLKYSHLDPGIMANPSPALPRAAKTDDTFELYDLKVEVVCPPDERILCGAKDGDYFLLEGEMLKLPPGQGISIYSLSTDEGFQ